MTPQAIARDIAAYYRQNPKRNWRQGSFGTRANGCCLYGAAHAVCNSYDLVTFEEAFVKQTGNPRMTLVLFNDQVATSVYDVLAVLDKVAAT